MNQKFYRLKFFQNFHSSFFQNSNHGTILIEFAFCVPVLVITMLAINDLFILFRTQDEMKRAAYCAVQLIQNVSKCRSIENRKITRQDMLNIVKAWNIVVPVTKKMSSTRTPLKLQLILFEGTGDDECKVKWDYQVVYYGNQYSSTWVGGNYQTEVATGFAASSLYGRAFRRNASYPSTSFYPDFHIKNGEIKIVLEIGLCNYDDADYIPNLLGLRFFRKSAAFVNKGNKTIYFFTYIPFTPINGIFDEDTPPQ